MTHDYTLYTLHEREGAPAFYCGRTRTLLKRRMKNHRYDARRGVKTLCAERIRAAGPDNIIAIARRTMTCTRDEADAAERELIAEHRTLAKHGGANYRNGDIKPDDEIERRWTREAHPVWRQDILDEDIRALLKSGLSQRAVARELGCSHTGIQHRLRGMEQ